MEAEEVDTESKEVVVTVGSSIDWRLEIMDESENDFR